MKRVLQFCLIISFISLVLTNIANAQSVQWMQTITGGSLELMQIASDANGNTYVTGDFTGTINVGDFQFTSGNTIYNNMFIAKYDANGNCIWAKANTGEEVDVRGISINSGGDIFVTGFFSGHNSFSGFDLNTDNFFDPSFVAKYDTAGNCLWLKYTSGSGGVTSYGVASNANGDCFITGYTVETVNFGNFTVTNNSGDESAFVAKYDPSGTCLWVRQDTGQSISEGHSLAVDANGNCYMAGDFQAGTAKFGNFSLVDNGSSMSAFISKYDPSGNCLWAVHDTGGYASTNCSAVAVDDNGNLYVDGTFQSGTTMFGNIKISTSSLDNSYLAKYDPNGNCLWVNQGKGKASTLGEGISIDKDNNSYHTGSFYGGEADFGDFKLLKDDGYANNIFIVKYDASGNCIWAIQDTGYASNNCLSTSDAKGNLYIVGAGKGWFGSFQFNGGFLAKLNTTVSAVNGRKSAVPHNFSLAQNYPNPFNPASTIEYSLPFASNVKIGVYNILGERVEELLNGEKPAGNYSINFNASGLSSGVYFYTLEAAGLNGKTAFRDVKKMILMK